jgi:vacuolar-type H+-ATPase subunit E/Vma4
MVVARPSCNAFAAVNADQAAASVATQQLGVHGVHQGGHLVAESAVQGLVNGFGGSPPTNEPQEQRKLRPEPAAQHQAVQVLTLAQRTAEEHIAGARHEADRICADAHATAEKIIGDARGHAHGLQQEAEKALSDAHAKATQMARDVQAHADDAQRKAEKILSDARARADETVKSAQARADELRDQAQQRYEDVVGSLAAKRLALQQQIEALEQFDREYRSRLTAFMQSQLRALWVDEPKVNIDEAEQPESAAGTAPEPEQADAAPA